uniref:L-aminoadipate-semialdehyde dehydrogenase-phosphopantetheinyl transferase n=1 Tax=Graphocephala atropunctata TaxID=36148 RepID=A0A1B6KSW7_9HEMI
MLTRLIMAHQAQRVNSARWAFNCGNWSPSDKDWQLLASGLDAIDKEQVGKFVFQKDAKSAMAGRFLTKKYVTEATGLAWRDIRILRDKEHKKPYLPYEMFGCVQVQFNISHSGDYVVLAGEVGDINLGVDLMKIEKQRTTSVAEFFRLMNKQFTVEEWDVMKSQTTQAEQMAMFYRFWCLKESYTKATGTGITVDLQKICFKLNSLVLSQNVIVDNTEVYVEGQKQEGWKFEESMIDGDHIATVAYSNCDESVKPLPNSRLFSLLTYSELISEHQQISETDCGYAQAFMTKKLKPGV